MEQLWNGIIAFLIEAVIQLHGLVKKIQLITPMILLGYAYYKRGSIDRKQFVQRNIKTEFSKFEKYKDAIPHGRCVL